MFSIILRMFVREENAPAPKRHYRDSADIDDPLSRAYDPTR